MNKKWTILIGFLFSNSVLLAQNPSVNYTSPQSYFVGTAISPLVPVSNNVAPLAYDNNITVAASGFNLTWAVAVDTFRNIYVADQGNNSIKKISAIDGTIVNLGSNFSGADGVAVDARGNIYVADENDNVIKKIAAGTNSVTTVASGFNLPHGLAVDAFGNVFVADYGNNTVREIFVNGGTQVLGSGFVKPTGVAVDVAGNVYVADSGNKSVKKIPFSGGPPIVIGAGYSNLSNVVLDPSNNLYVIDLAASTVQKISNDGSVVNIGSGFKFPTSVAIDRVGNIYVAELSGDVKKITPIGGYFINKTLPLGLNFDNNSGIISGTPDRFSFPIDYTITAYNNTFSSSTILNIQSTYGAGPTINYTNVKSFVVGKSITPIIPVSSGVAAPGFSDGAGTLSFGFNSPQGVAAVGYFNDVNVPFTLFIGDTGNSQVKFILTGNGVSHSLGTGFISPSGIAVDKSNNVYVADIGRNDVSKISNGIVTKIGSGYNSPTCVAVDDGGNVYVADQLNNSVKKIPPGFIFPITIGSGFNQPAGVAVDKKGNVYVADLGNHAVKEIAVIGENIVTIGTGFQSPTGVAVDVLGNVYVADSFYNEIKVIPQDGSAPYNIGSGFHTPRQLALDSAGNVIVADQNNSAVKLISRTGGFYINRPLPEGLVFDSATGIISGVPTEVTGSTNYTINAYNSTGHARATINFAIISDPTLANLEISSGTLSPTFSSDITNYTTSVSNTTSSIEVTPITSYSNTSVKVNGNSVASGNTSDAIPLVIGSNIITIIVTSSDGMTTKTYTIQVNRMSNNAYLSNLTLSSGTLSPAFASTTASYTASVSNATASITLTPTLNNPNATVKVNGVLASSGTASAAIPLAVGANIVTATITAQDGVTKKTYTVTITRALSDVDMTNIALSSGTLSPVFSSAITSYTASVTNATISITVTPTLNNAASSIKVNNAFVSSGIASSPITLAVGNTTINMVVTAPDGITKKVYTVVVTRVSNNAYLTNYTISSGTLSPVFSMTTSAYTAIVSNAITSVTVTPTLNNPHATITVNGKVITSGAVSQPIALVVGNTTINTVVTAQDGVTKKNYTITVTRVSNNPYLSNLTISTGTLSPVFAQATAAYTASVSNATTSVTVTPTLNNPHGTLTVNGTTVASGTASAAIALSVGTNSISTVVTAQDGVTHKTYTITVTRASGSLNSLYLPGSGKQKPLVAASNEKVEANNILSPNGDGINDIWLVKNIAFYPDNTVTVYNKVGEVIFTKKGYTNDWNGTYRSSVLSEGTYHYLIDLGDGTNIKGFITVVSNR